MLDFFKGTVTPKDWLFCGVVILIAAGAASGYFLVLDKSAQAKLQGVEAQIAKTKQDLDFAYKTRDDIEALREESRKMNLLVDGFEQRLPTEREIPRLLSQFEEMSANAGLKVELAALPPITEQKKETIPYRVKAYGKFHQIVSFINDIERDERYLKVSDLDINEEKDGISPATFTLSTFRFIENNTAGGGNEPKQ